jgi:hypothetical protein
MDAERKGRGGIGKQGNGEHNYDVNSTSSQRIELLD